MERLTDTTGQLLACGNNLCEDGMSCAECRYRDEAEHKFAAYEDTNLTPEECAELAAAKREGRIVVWPCSPDEPCFAIINMNCEYMDCPERDDDGNCNGECPFIVVEVDLHKTSFADLVRLPLYATRAEAEAALAGEG